MRNAVANLDDELFDAPSRKSRARGKPGKAGAKKRGGRGKRNRRNYGHYAALAFTAALTIGIVVNALVLQHSRHPAPLFGQAIMLGDQPMTKAALEPSAAVPVTSAPSSRAPETAAPPGVTPTAPANVDRTASLPVPHQRHTEAAAPAARAKGDDLIAKLLKTGNGAAPADKPGAKPRDKDEKESPKTIMAAQHALMKLGYVVKANGSFGPSTRAALEAFEREQHLPVAGELNHKLLKQLSAESGVAID